LKQCKEIIIPDHYSFKDYDVYDFDKALKIFDWNIKNANVTINLSKCFNANYQALSLLVLYVWHLKLNNCHIEIIEGRTDQGASAMWRRLGARGWSQILWKENQNFIGNQYKPLIALRSQEDFGKAISKAEVYTKGFNVEYEKTLRYVISELLYNTLEHGKTFREHNNQPTRIPSIIQFTWYKNKNELQFIVADLGIGIKNHLKQTYPEISTDKDAIRKALKYKVSGTFNIFDPYKNKDNAGVGLYISSSIIRKLHAEMHVLSGNGLVHISPRDTTSKDIKTHFPGTLVLVTIKLGKNKGLNLHKIMTELRKSAESEIQQGKDSEQTGNHYVSITNYFGSYAEDKQEAINYRDKHLLEAINAKKTIILDFDGVKAAPHSFLSALLATPIQRLGISAYKKIKFVNAEPEIRETIDYILDDNT